MLGGALLSLALRFPEEWHPIGRRPWILGVPYGISIVLGRVWDLGVVQRHKSLGLLRGMGRRLSLHCARDHCLSGHDVLPGVGQQIFVVPTSGAHRSVGQRPCLLSDRHLVAQPPLGVTLPFNPALFLPTLIIFPLSVAIAIFRYRLLEVDTFVNRTVFYGVMTAILAGVASGTITLCQKIFIAVTGEKSDMALVIATLILVAAFEPVKSRMRSLVDSRLKEAPDSTRDLRAFGHDIHRFLEMSDPELMTQRLLEETVKGLRAKSGSISLDVGGRLEPVHTVGRWQGDDLVCTATISEGFIDNTIEVVVEIPVPG